MGAISVNVDEGLRLPRRHGLRGASANAHLFEMPRVYAAPQSFDSMALTLFVLAMSGCRQGWNAAMQHRA
ncbi:hypothetical protein [Thiomonas intermedia]|uniref:hypothetical protein n=1 Tax=Thiomonas intermedia TaxID=926 RepID=UPI0012AC3AE6|nr:hypothetical protein [Thiomonas intermedia]